MAKRLGQRVKYGELCQCNVCKNEFEKTEQNFHFYKGKVHTYTCKECYKDKQYLKRLGIYKSTAQQNIPEGKICKCIDCGKSLKKNSTNFYYNTNGKIKCYICKPCYKKKEKERTYKRRELGLKIEKVVKDLREKTLLEIVNTRTFPKGHPMNPTKEQRQALIDQIENRRVYKNENVQQM